jgi:hypothetical protein
MLTVRKLFEKMNGLPPDTQVIVGIIEGGRYNALDAMPEVNFEPGQTFLYILCEQHERPWPPTTPGVVAETALSPSPDDD